MPSGCAALLTISRDQRRTVYRFPATRSRSLLTVEGALAKQSGFWEKRQGGIFRQRAPLDDISTESTVLPVVRPGRAAGFGGVRQLFCIFHLTNPGLYASL